MKTIYRYTLTNEGLVPEMRGHRHMSEQFDNAVTRTTNFELLKVDLKTNFKVLDPENFLKDWPVIGSSKTATYCGHGSAIKSGYAYFVVTSSDNEAVPGVLEWLAEIWSMLGIVENLYRFGAHVFPKTMFAKQYQQALVIGVPDGSILYCKDGSKTLFRDGHHAISKSVKRDLVKSGVKPFKFRDGSLMTPSVFSQLEPDAAVFEELLQGFDKRSKALSSEGYFKFVQASRFGGDREETLKGKSIFADIAMIEEIMAEIVNRGIDGRIMACLSRYPAFAPRLAKSLARDMFKVATTGGLKGTYYKILPCPSVPGESNVVVRKSNKTGRCSMTRYPVSDNMSTVAAHSVQDARLAYKAETVQLRVTETELGWSAKGTAAVRDLEGAYVVTPQGSRIEVPTGTLWIWGSEDQKMVYKPALEKPMVCNVEVAITEWYRPADVALVPCGYVVQADGSTTYDETLDQAHHSNADFDGDGIVVSWLGNRPALWEAFNKLNSQGLAIDKMAKSKNALKSFISWEGFEANSEPIYNMVAASVADYVGRITNLRERYMLYGAGQREKLAQSRFGMSDVELQTEFGFWLQLSVDLFKYSNQELIEKLEGFVNHVEGVFRLESSMFGEDDGLGQIKSAHVGKDKNNPTMGRGGMWFVNHIPETSEFEGLDGFIPTLARQTLARNENGSFKLWAAEIPNKGILPNATFNKWVKPPRKEAQVLADQVRQMYGKGAYGLGVGFEIDSDESDADNALRSEWLDFIHDLRIEVEAMARKARVSLQDLHDALWFNYTAGVDQQGSQDLPIFLMPDQFLAMLERLVIDEFGEFCHPEMVGKLQAVVEQVPLLNISQQWVGYPESPLVQELNGRTIRVATECYEVVRSGQKRVVSVVIPADDFSSFLSPVRGLPAEALGFTGTTIEGEFNATFKWMPGKNAGGTMAVSFSPIN